MSIEGIVLENFSALQQPSPLLYLGYLTYNAVFHSLFPDDSKHDAATTSTQSKKIIELLQNRQLLFWGLSTIWEDADGCAEKYRFTNALYLLSMLAHTYNIIIY